MDGLNSARIEVFHRDFIIHGCETATKFEELLSNEGEYFLLSHNFYSHDASTF